MARGKKAASTLSPEEKLQQALVPVEEQPYPIPENWCWVKLQSISRLFNGDRGANYPSKKDYVPVGIPFINAGAIVNYEIDYSQFNYITEEKYDSLRAGKIQHGDILYCLRGSLGKTAIVTENIRGAISSSLCIIRVDSSAERKYIYFLLSSDTIIKQQEQAENGSAQPNLSAASVMAYSVPLPPLPEQHRIVTRIESLFTKLDEAKEKAQAVVDGFELRKSAILHQAFTGELTEKWRKEHGVGLDSWTDTTIGEQAELITKGASPRWQGVEYTDDKSQTLFVTSENVREGYLDFTKEKYLSNEINDIQKRSILNYGDVLVNIVGASIGRAAIYNLHQLANTNQAVCIVRLKSGISNEFVCAYLNAPLAQSYYYDNKVETARANVSLGSISAMHISLPTSSEQKEIVDTFNKVLEMERQAKTAAEAVLAQIGAMKKAILARAFRGELGTNDPAEEWAGELVKKIL